MGGTKRKRNEEDTPKEPKWYQPLTEYQTDIKLFRQAAKRYEKYLPKILWKEIEQFWMLPKLLNKEDAKERMATFQDNKNLIDQYYADTKKSSSSTARDIRGYVWHPCPENFTEWGLFGYCVISKSTPLPVDDLTIFVYVPSIQDTTHDFWDYCVQHVRRGSSKLLIHISPQRFWLSHIPTGTYGSVVWMSKRHPGLLGFLPITSDSSPAAVATETQVRYIYVNTNDETKRRFSMMFPYEKILLTQDQQEPLSPLCYISRSRVWAMEHHNIT